MSDFQFVGKPANNVDGFAKVMGKARFVGDLQLPGDPLAAGELDDAQGQVRQLELRRQRIGLREGEQLAGLGQRHRVVDHVALVPLGVTALLAARPVGVMHGPALAALVSQDFSDHG